MSATAGGATVTGADVDTIGKITERLDDAIIRLRGVAEGLGHVLNACSSGNDSGDLLALLLTDMRGEVAALERQSAGLAEVWRAAKLAEMTAEAAR
jgi:hypothetical protein